MKRFLQLVIVLLVPAIASASTLWKGDFETGNLSQWSGQESVASDRLLVVSDVVHDGRYALKATVHKGDNPISASGNRNELFYLSRETPGQEYFYKWSTMFPQDYPSANTWQLFAQWHQDGCCGSPPMEFYLVGEEMRMRVGGNDGQILWQAPLVRGHWNDFVLHVKWSSDPKVGFVELYKDGQRVVPRTMVATQFGSEKNYLKLGLYRDASISQTASVYHDGFVMGTTLEDVMPTAAVTPPEATPAPQPTPPTTTPGIEQPSPAPGTTPPVANTNPAANPPVSHTTQPDSADGPPGDLQYGQGQGCGASASGGAPVVAAVLLLAAALLARRRPALARSRARRS